MHPHNPYFNQPPDFSELAQGNEALSQHLSHFRDKNGRLNPAIDYKDGFALRCLTEATLQQHFGIHATLPSDKLCPTVPNRLNYIAWLEELIHGTRSTLNTINHHADDRVDVPTASRPRKRARKEVEHLSSWSSPSPSSSSSSSMDIHVLDIGTGASCIYPILGCSLHPNWDFVGTDIDPQSISQANAIINDHRNNTPIDLSNSSTKFLGRCSNLQLRHRISLLLRTTDDSLFPEREVNDPIFHATMCNPPFYSSREEMETSAKLKEQEPTASCTGNQNEIITKGGEVAFVSQMILESLSTQRQASKEEGKKEKKKEWKEKVWWFTTMIGKLSNLFPLLQTLQKEKVENFTITEFVQGKTKRWALAWTVLPIRPFTPLSLPSALKGSLAHSLPCRNWKKFQIVNQMISIKELSSSLLHVIGELDDENEINATVEQVLSKETMVWIKARKDCWSRKARRQQKRGLDRSKEDSGSLDYLLVVSSSLFVNADGGVEVMVWWRYGWDYTLFESFTASVIGRWVKGQNEEKQIKLS